MAESFIFISRIQLNACNYTNSNGSHWIVLMRFVCIAISYIRFESWNIWMGTSQWLLWHFEKLWTFANQMLHSAICDAVSEAYYYCSAFHFKLINDWWCNDCFIFFSFSLSFESNRPVLNGPIVNLLQHRRSWNELRSTFVSDSIESCESNSSRSEKILCQSW